MHEWGSPLDRFGSPFGLSVRNSVRSYNGSAILGGALLPAGTTGNHNGLPVIGVKNVNLWPPTSGVKGVDVRSGGDSRPPYVLGMNINHQLATGTGHGYVWTNLIRGAWQIRPQNGAMVDGNGFPASATGDDYILIECPRFVDGMEAPYTGRHWLITNYACDVEVILKQASGTFPDYWGNGVVTTVDGSTTPTLISFDVPTISGPHYIYLRIKNITSVPAGAKTLALVHDRYLADYQASAGKVYFNRDRVYNYLVPLATAETNPRVIDRTMKATKTNADPKLYPSAAYDKDNLSYHSGFVDPFDVIEDRIRFGLTGSTTVNVGETITQANTLATGLVVSQALPTLNPAGTPETNGTLYLRLTTGTFNTVDELSGDETGALGANSVPTSITSYPPAEHATPYEVLLEDAVYWQSVFDAEAGNKRFVPWICLQPDIDDSDFDAFCTALTAAFAAGLTEVYIELGNEPWLMNGINSADWFRNQGVAKWGAATPYGTTANIGRAYKARLDMLRYDRMRTNLGATDMAKVKWTACDQPGYIPGLQAYLDGTLWADVGEEALKTEWTTPATNPISVWSWATYWGNGSDNIDWADQAAVEASLRASIDNYVSLIGSSTNFMRAWLGQAKADSLEFLSYEGGYSVYGRPHNFEDTQMMYDLYYEAYDKFRGIGNTGTLLYADAGPPQGTNGDWNHGINLLDGLSGKYRGRALIDYAQDQRDSLIPATGTHNSSAVRGMVLITDGGTTYNGEPVEEINFLTGIAGAGGNPAIMQKFVHLITEQSTPIPLSLHDEGDLLLFYVGVDRGENVNANCTFGVSEGWTKVANIQSGSDEFRTEGWLWAKVAGATEALPTLALDGSPPVSQHGQGIMVVLKNVNSVIGTASTYATSANGSNSWGPLTGPTLTDANELVVFFGTDRRPKQPWVITPAAGIPTVTNEVNNASGSLGNLCTSYFGHVLPGAVGAMGDFTVGFNRVDGNYRPHLIAAVLGKV